MTEPNSAEHDELTTEQLSGVQGGWVPWAIAGVGLAAAGFWQVWNAGHNKGLQDRQNRCPK